MTAEKRGWRDGIMDMHPVSYLEAAEYGGMPCRNCNGTGFVPYGTGTVTPCIECESGIIFHDDEHELEWILRKTRQIDSQVRRLQESKAQLKSYEKLIREGDR